MACETAEIATGNDVDEAHVTVMRGQLAIEVHREQSVVDSASVVVLLVAGDMVE